MRLVKCTASFMIGFYLAFVITLSVTGYLIVKKFVSKDLLKQNKFYLDGDVYEIKRK